MTYRAPNYHYLRRHGHTWSRRSHLTCDDYWLMSPQACLQLLREIDRDGRRSWIPWYDTPSLASLKGEAKRYGGHYARSRSRLLSRARVRVREIYEREAGRRVWIVVAEDEPLSAAYRVERTGRGQGRLVQR